MSENAIVKKPLSGKLLLPILCAVIGILLLFLGGMSGKEGSAQTENDATLSSGTQDASAFAADAEARIAAICTGIAGVDEVQAVVTLSGGYRAVYAADAQYDGDSYRNVTVLKGSGSSESALLVGYENPEIAGVGIVCRGGDDPAVRERIVRLISSAFDIGTHKIYVAGR